MKIHIGVDKDSGLIHSVATTAANVHDLTPVAELLHGDEEGRYSGQFSRIPRSDASRKTAILADHPR